MRVVTQAMLCGAARFRLEVGDRLGDIELVEVLEERGANRERVGVFRCECGSRFARRVAQVAYAVRGGWHPACGECARRLRKLHYELNVKPQIDEALRELWAATGTLYSVAWEERETRALRAKLGIDTDEPTLSTSDMAVCTACFERPRPKPKASRAKERAEATAELAAAFRAARDAQLAIHRELARYVEVER